MADLDDGPEAQDRIAELEARLERIERARSMTSRSRSLMNRVVPPEASTHFRAAGREQLLGVRALMDHWIRRMDEHRSPCRSIGRRSRSSSARSRP